MSRKNHKHINRNLLVIGIGLVTTYMVMKLVAKKGSESESIDDDNPYLRVSTGKDLVLCKKTDDKGIDSEIYEEAIYPPKVGIYEGMIKQILDQLLSFAGIVLLSPLYLLISLAVYLDDPGPVFFTQKRVGKDKHFFMLHKYRSMKMSTPHDVPTHQLSDPEQYITRVGAILRKTSLDELPQIWDIFRGRMSVIGPRPALWNQDDLVEYRDRYGANSLLPGLTGLAQIKGRDELMISDKAKLDGEYAKVLHCGGVKAFLQDVVCFMGTVGSVLKQDGVVEGGTGILSNLSDAGFDDYGFKKVFDIDTTLKKRVLITGAGSYIGESFANWTKQYYPNIEVSTVDMLDKSWKEYDFRGYDAVFHVAGIAHADIGNVNEEEKKRYYAVNTDLAIETAQKSKESGVSQFIFLSSMIVYGDPASWGKERMVDEHTDPLPSNFYGDSKWQADKKVRDLCDERFRVAVLRLPMVYGRESKGNYPILSKIAKKIPVFPAIENRRSMIHINNLCEFVCKLVFSGEGGVYFPQNAEYSNTSELVKTIALIHGRKIHTTRMLNFVVRFASYMPGKIGNLTDKAFGNSIYDQKLSRYKGLDYQVVDLKESIVLTEEKMLI